MVYLLETTKYEWDRVPFVPRELADKQVKGIALQQSDMPAESLLDGLFELPDICRPTLGFLFVSDRCRAVLEELAPGCVAFLPLNLSVPERMSPAKSYFFIDVFREFSPSTGIKPQHFHGWYVRRMDGRAEPFEDD